MKLHKDFLFSIFGSYFAWCTRSLSSACSVYVLLSTSSMLSRGLCIGRNQSVVFVFEHSFLQVFELLIYTYLLYKYSIHMTTTHYFSFWKTNLKAELNLCYFWLIDQQGFIQFQFFCSLSKYVIKGQPSLFVSTHQQSGSHQWLY